MGVDELLGGATVRTPQVDLDAARRSIDERVRRRARRRATLAGAGAAVVAVAVVAVYSFVRPDDDGRVAVVTDVSTTVAPTPGDGDDDEAPFAPSSSATIGDARITISVDPVELPGLRIEVGAPVASDHGWFAHDLRLTNTSDRIVRIDDNRTSLALGEPPALLVAEPGCGYSRHDVGPDAPIGPGACLGDLRSYRAEPGETIVQEWWAARDLPGLVPGGYGTFRYEKIVEYSVGGADSPVEQHAEAITITYEIAAASGGSADPSSRSFAATAWTGTHYLVWGGEAGSETSTPNDGWAFDPATGEISPIPAAPVPGRSGATGVWTGSELIVCCGSTLSTGGGPDLATAAAYDPATGSWRRLADPPESLVARERMEVSRYPASVWTGSEMLVVSGDDGVETFVAAYDPATDTWRDIDGAPHALHRQPEIAWTGDELVVWGGWRTWPPGGADDAITGARYDPVLDVWTELPAFPDGGGPYDPSMAWTGEELVVWGYSGWSWDPDTDEWTPLPDPGLPAMEEYEGSAGSQAVVWDPVRQRVVLYPTHGYEYGSIEGGAPGPVPLLAYDPTTRSWERLGEVALGYSPDLTSGGGWLLWPTAPDPVVLAAPE